MENYQIKSYPTILDAVHLLMLYIFMQSIVDFPLAMLDYYNGTDYLANPVKSFLLDVFSTFFIFYFAWRKAAVPLKQLFPANKFNLLILIPLLIFLWAAHNIIGEINVQLEKVLPPPAWFLELFQKLFDNDHGIYGTILKVVIIAPTIEEMLFRGVIMHGLMRNYSKFTAVFTSALLFALFHLNPWQFPATFTLGLLLGILMLRTQNIYLCIIGHAFNNGLVLFSIYYWQDIQNTEIMQTTKISLLIFSALIVISALLLIFFLSRPFNRKAN